MPYRLARWPVCSSSVLNAVTAPAPDSSHTRSAKRSARFGSCRLASTAAPTEADVREYLVGNICRCTGYNNVVKAVLAAAGAATGAATDDKPAGPEGAPPASARPESIGAGAAEGRTA